MQDESPSCAAGMNEDGAAPSLLRGRKLLMVEDEAIVAFLIEDMLLSFGCEAPRHAVSVRQALAFLSDERPDAAVLDINLSGEMVYPVAEQLEALGIPFVFATGYGVAGLPKRFLGRPVLQKPFTPEDFSAAMIAVLS